MAKEAKPGPEPKKPAPFIIWRPEYDLGIPLLDKQHLGIIATINALYDAMSVGQGESALAAAIEMVSGYTVSHFGAEEAFHRDHAYPEADCHRKLHEEIASALPGVGRKSSWGNDPREFLNFLKKWFIDHICRQDRAFRDFLRENEPGVLAAGS